MSQVSEVASSSTRRFQDFAAAFATQSVIIADDKQSLVWASPAALRLHGVDRPDELGATVSDYVTNFRLDYIHRAGLAAGPSTTRDAGLCEGTLRFVRRYGDNVPMQCQMQLLAINDPLTNTSSTAMILRPESSWLDASTPACGGEPDGPDPGSAGMPMNMKTGAARSSSMPERNSAAARHWQAGDMAATSRRDIAARAGIICAAAPVALHVLNAEMRILGVSDAWLNWLGYDSASVIGRDVGLFMDVETRLQLERQLGTRERDGGLSQTIHCRFRKQSGETVDTVVAASCVDESGDLAYVTCVPVECGAPQHDEASVRLITQSPVPTLCWQLDDLSVREANQAFYTLTGHPAGSLAGQNLDNLGLCETKSVRHKLEQELRASGTVQRQDFRIRASKGEMLTCSLSATLIRLSGKPCGVLMLQDVSERRRDEAQLFEAIEAVMKDSAWFSRTVIEKLAALRSPPKSSGRHAELAELTRREREVLTLISVGQCDLDIARQLGLTRSTVRNHVATLYSKIDVHSRSAAIVWARERGINLTMGRAAPREAGRTAPL